MSIFSLSPFQEKQNHCDILQLPLIKRFLNDKEESLAEN